MFTYLEICGIIKLSQEGGQIDMPDNMLENRLFARKWFFDEKENLPMAYMVAVAEEIYTLVNLSKQEGYFRLLSKKDRDFADKICEYYLANA